MSEWPEELDAVIAAPNHHRILMENDRVRVLETRVEPGDTVPCHTHRCSGANYLISWSDFIRRDGGGQVLLDTREAGIVMDAGSSSWQQPLGPHTLENVGGSTLVVITVELKGG